MHNYIIISSAWIVQSINPSKHNDVTPMTSDSTYVLHLGRFETSRALLPKWAHENMEKLQNTHLAPNASLWDRHTSFPPRRLGLQLIVGSMEKVLRNMRSIGGCIALSQTRQMGTLYSTWHIPHHARKGSSPHDMSCPSKGITLCQSLIGTQREFLCNTNTRALHSKVILTHAISWPKS